MSNSKKILSVLLALILALSVLPAAPLSVSAAVSDSFTPSADKLYFDTDGTGWDMSTSKDKIAFYIMGGDFGTDENPTQPISWGGKKLIGTANANETGIYEIDPIAKLGYRFTEGVQYKIIFVHTNGANWREQTCSLYFTTDCFGHVAYSDGSEMENDVDSSKKSLAVYWRGIDPEECGPVLCITSVGNVVGSCVEQGKTKYSLFEEFLSEERMDFGGRTGLENARYYTVEQAKVKTEQEMIDDIGTALELTVAQVEAAFKETGVSTAWSPEMTTMEGHVPPTIPSTEAPTEAPTEPSEEPPVMHSDPEHFEYEVEEGFAYITGYNGTYTDIEVPSELGGAAVVEIYEAFSGKPITSVKLPDTLKMIGSDTFKDCKKLTEITLPQGCESIESEVFSGCTSLQKINLPDGLTKIGYAAFSGCASLEDITLPDTLNYIGVRAFAGCVLFKDITIPDTLTCIGRQAFYGCKLIKEITIPATTLLDEGAFEKCAEDLTIYSYTNSFAEEYAEKNGVNFVSLGTVEDPHFPYTITDGKATVTGYRGTPTDIVIPDTLGGAPVTAIGAKAFWSRDDLHSVTLPDTVTEIGDYAFRACKKLASVKFPDSLRSIGEAAFWDCKALDSLDFPDSLQAIEKGAFFNTGVESVDLPDELQTLGYGAFGLCGDLRNISWPRDLKKVSGPFENCTALEEVTIPDSVTDISGRSFSGCTSLKKVTIPANAAVGDDAFADCADDLTIYGYTNSYADHYAFRYHIDFVSLGEVADPYLQYSVTDGEATVEYYSGYKTDPVIPSTYKGVPVTAVAFKAFNSKPVTSIILPDTVKRIDSSAFVDCTALSSVILPEGLEKIGYKAFGNCTALTEITVPETVAVDVDAFMGCSDALTICGYTYSTAEDCAIEKGFHFVSIGEAKDRSHYYQYTVEDGKATIIRYSGRETDITIPATLGGAPVTNIGDGVFYERPIRSITIPDTVTEIGSYAFTGCESLPEITLPDGLQKIGSAAFSGCTALREITVPENTWMEPGVFEDTDTLTVYGYTYSYAYDATLNKSINFVSLGEAKDRSHYYTYTVTDGKTTVTRYKGTEVDIVIPDTLGGYPVVALANRAFAAIKYRPDSIVVPESVEKIGSYALSCNPKTVTVLSRNAEYGYNYFGDDSYRMILRGYAGSTTELYAKSHYNNFIPIGMDYDADSQYCYGIYDKEVTIYHYLGDDHDLILPSELSGCPVTTISGLSIPNHAWDNDTASYRLVIPESVKNITHSALYGPRFSDVTIYSKDVSFDGFVFRWYVDDHTADDYSEMTVRGYAGSDVDAYCTEYQLNFVPIGTERAEDPDYDYITYNGSAHILRYKGNKQDVTVPRELGGYPVTEISNRKSRATSYDRVDYVGAFENTDVQSVTLPDTLIEIGRSAFEGCTQLAAIIIPDSVTTISGHAFKDCTALESIHIPASVTTINYYDSEHEGLSDYIHAFEGCTGLKTITVDENNPVYDSRDNCNAIIDTEWNSIVRGCRNTVIPDTVNRIGEMAFKDCIGLTEVTIPDNVDIIYDNAFQNCTDLTYVKLPDSVYGEVFFYSSGAFKGCTGLEQVVVPPSIYINDLFKSNFGLDYHWDYSLNDYVVEKYPDSKLTIYGYYGTWAEKYAVKYDFPFRMIAPSMSDEVTVDAPEGATYSVVKKATDDEVSPDVASPDEAAPAEKQPLPKDSIFLSVYDITLRDIEDEKPVQPEGPVTVRIRCDNPKVHVFRRETYGALTDMHARYEDGYLVFETDHFSDYLLVEPGAEIDIACSGDADGDGEITVFDVTKIQRYCVGMAVYGDPVALMNADVDGNGEVEIIDATFLQRYLAGMTTPYPIGETLS